MYRICSIRHRGHYLFHHTILCSFYSRAATILEWHLLNSEVLVELFVKIRALGKASFIRLTKNLDALTWSITSASWPAVALQSSTYTAPPIWHWNQVAKPLCQRWRKRRRVRGERSCSRRLVSPLLSFTVTSFVTSLEVRSWAHMLFEYELRLLFESSHYFVQHIGRCSDNSRAAANQEWRLIRCNWSDHQLGRNKQSVFGVYTYIHV